MQSNVFKLCHLEILCQVLIGEKTDDNYTQEIEIFDIIKIITYTYRSLTLYAKMKFYHIKMKWIVNDVIFNY